MLAELYNMNRTLLGLIITVFIFRRQYVSSDHLCGLVTFKVMSQGGKRKMGLSVRSFLEEWRDWRFLGKRVL